MADRFPGGAAAAVLGLVVLVAASPDRPRQLASIGIGLAGALVLVAASETMHSLTRDIPDSASRSDGDVMSVVSVVVVALTALASSRFGRARPNFRVSHRARLAVGVVAALAIVAAVLIAHPAQRFREFKAPPPTQTGVAVGGPELSSNGRWQFWGAAVDAFESEPLRGVGAGGFEGWWGVHGDIPLFVRNPHSLPLQDAVDFGIPGIALFLGFCAALAVGSRRALSASPGGECRRAHGCPDLRRLRCPLRLDLGDPGGLRSGGYQCRSPPLIGALCPKASRPSLGWPRHRGGMRCEWSPEGSWC